MFWFLDDKYYAENVMLSLTVDSYIRLFIPKNEKINIVFESSTRQYCVPIFSFQQHVQRCDVSQDISWDIGQDQRVNECVF